MKPVVKWAGGKTQLLDEIRSRLPKNFDRYIEPFLGGASVLFSIKPNKALVNDINPELINMYKVIRNNSKALMSLLDVHEEKFSEDYYYAIRKLDRLVGLKNLSHIYRSSRFIFLNKAGFNGLYRVNSDGFMNVPFGHRQALNTYDRSNIELVSDYFNEKNIIFYNQDYKVFLLENVQKNAFVYLDHPYDQVTDSSFVSYQKQEFGRKEQFDLKEVCVELHKRGAKIMLSNSNTNFINNLYSEDGDIFNIAIVDARRSINANGNSRGVVKEIIVRNYKDD